MIVSTAPVGKPVKPVTASPKATLTTTLSPSLRSSFFPVVPSDSVVSTLKAFALISGASVSTELLGSITVVKLLAMLAVLPALSSIVLPKAIFNSASSMVIAPLSPAPTV